MKNFNLDQKCSFLFVTYICVLCNISIIEKKSASIYLNLSSEMRQKIRLSFLHVMYKSSSSCSQNCFLTRLIQQEKICKNDMEKQELVRCCKEKTIKLFICMRCNRRSLLASIHTKYTHILCAHGRAKRDRARDSLGSFLQLVNPKQMLPALLPKLYHPLNFSCKGCHR